jgi:hypothetical protein
MATLAAKFDRWLRSDRLPKIALAVALLATVAMLAGPYLWSGAFGHREWERLVATERSLGVPVGFELMGREREGTTTCVISCNEARLRLVLRTELSVDDACDRMADALASVDRIVGEVDRSVGNLDGCFLGIVLDGPAGAGLTANIVEADALAAIEDREPAWVVDAARAASGERIVEVLISSGID